MPEPKICPTCSSLLRRSTGLIPDALVLACQPCRKMAVYVEGIIVEWLPAGPDIVQRLKEVLEQSLLAKDILTSDDDDPRWHGVG